MSTAGRVASPLSCCVTAPGGPERALNAVTRRAMLHTTRSTPVAFVSRQQAASHACSSAFRNKLVLSDTAPHLGARHGVGTRRGSQVGRAGVAGALERLPSGFGRLVYQRSKPPGPSPPLLHPPENISQARAAGVRSLGRGRATPRSGLRRRGQPAPARPGPAACPAPSVTAIHATAAAAAAAAEGAAAAAAAPARC